VDNVGTKLTRSDVDNFLFCALGSRQWKASMDDPIADDLGITCGQPRVEPVENSIILEK
jgi:hypothetical protein